MKVLMVGPDSTSKGGISTVIHNFKKNYNNPKVEITYFSTWKEGSLLYRIVYSISMIVRFIYTLITKKTDIVHIHLAQNGSFYRKAIIVVISKMLNKRVLLHSHASKFDDFYNNQSSLIKKYISFIFNLSDTLIVLGDNWKEFYSEITSTSIKIIYNAVPNNFEARYDVESNLIVTLGRIGERKGSYDMLKVCQKILLINPSLRFEIYGDGEIEKVQRVIDENKIDNVTLMGWITEEEKKRLFNKAALHILPSYHEGMPMSILETMSAGIPNISTNVGEIPYVIDNEIDGLVISPGDVNKLVESIITIMKDKNKRVDMSGHARTKIDSKFSLKTYFDSWEAIYFNQGD